MKIALITMSYKNLKNGMDNALKPAELSSTRRRQK
jgi:hypothetical protein